MPNELVENKNNDYVAWIGHATFLIKLGKNIIITDKKSFYNLK